MNDDNNKEGTIVVNNTLSEMKNQDGVHIDINRANTKDSKSSHEL